MISFASAKIRRKFWSLFSWEYGQKKGGSAVARIEGVDPNHTQGPLRAVFEAQIKKWGAPLLNHLVYARRPTIFRGVRAMYSGLDSSALIDAKLVSLINRRVAAINGCEF
jgi:hypothetical protein